MVLYKKNGIMLPKSHPQYNEIVVDLDRIMYGWNNDVNKIKFYQEYDNHVLIPRFYPLNDTIKDLTTEGEDIVINSKITPRNKPQELAIDFLTNNKNGILRLEPGRGKTVISIASICNVKKKTIIFMHKDKLIKQWTEEILLHTDLTKDNIGRLSTANYKKVLKLPIILSTVQAMLSLLNGKKKDDFIKQLGESNIGMAIFDECHTTVGPEKFTEVSLALNCNKIHGLSATPTRQDKNEDIIYYHLGQVTYFPPEENELLIPKIFMLFFPFGVYEGKTIKYLRWGGIFQLARYQNLLEKRNSYLQTVSKVIRKLHNEKHTILVLGTRVSGLIKLAECTEIKSENIGIFIPGSTPEQRLSVSDTDDLDVAFTQKDVVFSTYLAARDGNNRKDLDTLIMSVPTSNIEQAIGRIQRELAGKRNPIVVDFVDTQGPEVKDLYDKEKKTSWFLRSAQKREEQYKALGWKVEKMNLRVEKDIHE